MEKHWFIVDIDDLGATAVFATWKDLVDKYANYKKLNGGKGGFFKHSVFGNSLRLANNIGCRNWKTLFLQEMLK